MTQKKTAHEFFDTYTRALLNRDVKAVADHYAVPALIEFPEQPVAVSDPAQTEEFFAAAFGQYDGITDAHAAIHIIAETRHSLWVDVTWSYDGTPTERNVYQLVQVDGEWKIAVLTPMDT